MHYDRSAAAAGDGAAATGVGVGRLPGAGGVGPGVLLAVAEHLAVDHGFRVRQPLGGLGLTHRRRRSHQQQAQHRHGQARGPVDHLLHTDE